MCQALRTLMKDEITIEVNRAEQNGELLGFVKCARLMGMSDEALVEKLMEMYKISKEAAVRIISPAVA